MRKTLFSLIGIMGILLFSLPANAFTFTGTASGKWVNVTSTAYNDVYSVNNNDNDGVASFNWGIGAPGSFDNEFSFDGVGSDGGAGWEASLDEAFLIGDFDYRNGSTYYSNGIEGVDLALTLAITDPVDSVENHEFGFSITNTPNDTGNPVTDGDIVTATTLFSGTDFVVGGTEYTLELLGFSIDGGNTIISDFSSPEGATASAGIYGRITSSTPDTSATPEPATIFLLGSGMVGVSLRKRFMRNRKSSADCENV